MILPYDPFGMNRMVYTVKNQCVEDSNVEYDDGALKIFLNTKGTSGDTSQELQKMLKYIECSIAENVANDNIQAIHDYVEKVKKDKDVEVQYMKSWEVEQLIREEAQKEGLEKGRKEGLEQGHIELRNYVLEVRAGNTTIEQLREKGVKQELLEIIQVLV